MKKIIVIALCFAFSILLTSCGEISVSESSETAKPNSAIKWFDCLNGDEMVWDGVKAVSYTHLTYGLRLLRSF